MTEMATSCSQGAAQYQAAAAATMRPAISAASPYESKPGKVTFTSSAVTKYRMIPDSALRRWAA